jgi:hypothetical protein
MLTNKVSQVGGHECNCDLHLERRVELKSVIVISLNCQLPFK